MGKWYCFRCEREAIESYIPATYMEITRNIRVMKCPKCGIAFVTEQDAVELSEDERWLEEKT